MISALAVALFGLDMATGDTAISLADVWRSLVGGDVDPITARIVIDIRLVKAVVAVLVGAALASSGLQMQTLFRNPLAGPYVLGITSGASLGVALLMLGAPLLGLSAGMMSAVGVAGAAWIGAAAVLVVVAAVSVRIKDIMVILILGMMLSSGIGAVVQMLQYVSDNDSLKTFVIWTMGSLGDVTKPQLWLLIPAVVAGLAIGVGQIKPLNLLQLGPQYAQTMGLSLGRSRTCIFLSTTLLAGTVTAFCGPIGFVGLAVPHVARRLYSNADMRALMPGSVLLGIVMMLACDIASKTLAVPVNTVTALLGIPVVVWVVMRNR